MVGLWGQLAGEHVELDSFYEPCEGAEANFETYLRQAMASSNFVVLACLDGKSVVGYLLGSIELHPPVVKCREYGFIDNLVVDSVHRRLGAGSMLVDSAVNWFRSNGVKRVELNVTTSNRPGLAFWESCGFTDFQHVMFLDQSSR